MDNISIIGSGIGGLMTALCFDKLDINYKLYERVQKLKEIQHSGKTNDRIVFN